MHSSRLSAVQLATHIFKKLQTWSDIWSHAVKHIYPKNVYQLRETLFDKLDSIGIQYTDDQKLFTNLAVFDFESICITEEKFKNTETTTWIGKHVPISVSISSNLIAKPIFICNSNPRDLVESFHLERYCNVLPVFGFNSAKYDNNLIKSYLLPILINERNMEPIVIKKADQFVSFKFGDVQLLDIMNFLGGATSLDSFLRAYKTAETKGFFPYEWFDCPQKVNNSELPSYDAFFSKLRNVNPLEKHISDYQNLLRNGLKSEEALSKMKLSKLPPSGEENYHYLLDIWNHENMCTFKDFLRWYNNKDVVPTLEAMQKVLAFYHQK